MVMMGLRSAQKHKVILNGVNKMYLKRLGILNKRKAWVFFFFLVKFGLLYSQEFQLKDILGTWKPKDLIWTLHSQETHIEKQDDSLAYVSCLKSLISIDTSAFSIKNGCGFEGCDSLLVKRPSFVKIPICKDTTFTIQAPGQEIIEMNKVGETFIKLLDKNYSKDSYSKDSLIIVDTYCKESFGNFTVKICIVNKNRIGLFNGGELIILERINNISCGMPQKQN